MPKHKHGADNHAHHGKGGGKMTRSTDHHNGKKNPGAAKSMSRKIRPAGELKMDKGGRSKRLAGVKI